MSPEQRSTLYAAVPAIAAVLTVYGVWSDEQAATVTAAVVSVLAVVVAFAHRPTKDEGR